MNDIYEYKARKYKHKYLKLKREYIGGKESTTRRTVNKFRYKFNLELVPITEPEISKGIDHSQPPSIEQTNFKDILVNFRKYIKDNIESLYENNDILGNIYFRDIFYKDCKAGKDCIKITVNNSRIINLIIDKKTILKFNTNIEKINIKEIDFNKLMNNRIKFSNYQYINPYKDKERKVNPFNISYAPIILEWFNNICEINKNGKITKTEIDSLFKKYNKYNSLIKFKKDFDKKYTYYLANYSIEDIFNNCIKNEPYIKNIDYYSIAMIIYNLCKEFIGYYEIVENIELSSTRLPQLFEKIKKKYYDHEIEKESFLKDFDLIISLIK